MASQRRRPWSGAFSKYVSEKAGNVWRVPEHLSWEQAASIGCGVTTSVGMALWWVMKLRGTPEEPTTDPKFVLVHGGLLPAGPLPFKC